MKFEFGDTVKVTNMPYKYEDLNGMIGTVVCFSKFIDGEDSIGVDFGVQGYLHHDLDGALSDHTGRYFSESRLVLMDGVVSAIKLKDLKNSVVAVVVDMQEDNALNTDMGNKDATEHSIQRLIEAFDITDEDIETELNLR